MKLAHDVLIICADRGGPNDMQNATHSKLHPAQLNTRRNTWGETQDKCCIETSQNYIKLFKVHGPNAFSIFKSCRLPRFLAFSYRKYQDLPSHNLGTGAPRYEQHSAKWAPTWPALLGKQGIFCPENQGDLFLGDNDLSELSHLEWLGVAQNDFGQLGV